MNKTILLLLAVLITPAASAYAEDPRCSRLLKAYENAERIAASEYADGMMDNSAPRASMHHAAISNTLVERQMNLSMMIALSCPLPDDPASSTGAAFLISAIKCRTAQIKGDSKSPDCELSKWQRAPLK